MFADFVDGLTEEQFAALRDAAYRRHKRELGKTALSLPPISEHEASMGRIDAIKAYRDRVGCTLAVAKSRLDTLPCDYCKEAPAEEYVRAYDAHICEECYEDHHGEI